jgi:hypothetical protein
MGRGRPKKVLTGTTGPTGAGPEEPKVEEPKRITEEDTKEMSVELFRTFEKSKDSDPISLLVKKEHLESEPKVDEPNPEEPKVEKPKVPEEPKIEEIKVEEKLKKMQKEKPIKDIPDGSICPFLRAPCIQKKCGLWFGTIEEEEEKIEINRCGFVFSGQMQMQMNSLLALIYTSGENEDEEEEGENEEGESDETPDATYKELTEEPKLDLNF